MDILEMLTESGQVHYALIWLACSLASGYAEMQNRARPGLRDFAKGAEFKITKPNAPFKHRGQWMDTGGRACQHSKKGMTEWAIIALVPIIEAPKQRAAPPPIICSDETGPVLRIRLRERRKGGNLGEYQTLSNHLI